MKSLFTLLLASALLFAEEGNNSFTAPDSAIMADTVSVEQIRPIKRIYNYRYQIGSAFAMMLFFGLMVGTSESMNPR